MKRVYSGKYIFIARSHYDTGNPVVAIPIDDFSLLFGCQGHKGHRVSEQPHTAYAEMSAFTQSTSDPFI